MKAKVKTADFVNAKLMHLENPETFSVPADIKLACLSKDDIVKVCAGGERFWVDVLEVNGEQIIGTVNNDLICTEDHGLKCGDKVVFTKDNVYSIY